jgi:hypothetical protein
MKPKTAAFLRQTLPRSEGGHMLTLGEVHTHAEHLDFLREQLPTLVKNHHLGTIGLERPLFLNVFLWAYRDGTLARELGTKEAARAYLTGMFEAHHRTELHDNAIASAKLCIAALDGGINVIAYDGRDRLKDEKDRWSKTLKSLDQFMLHESESTRQSKAEFEQKIRSENPDRFVKNKKLKFTYMLHEVDHWLKKKPEYQEKLTAMERIITLGQKKGVGGDAIAATLLQSAANPAKNTISIAGAIHISGIGAQDSKKNIQGTLPHHLKQMRVEGRPAPTITAAILAGTGMVTDITKINRGWIEGKGDYASWYHEGPIVRGEPVPVIDIARDEITELSQALPKDERHVGLKERFGPTAKIVSGCAGITSNPRINPLRDPEIKAAADDVARLLHGEHSCSVRQEGRGR